MVCDKGHGFRGVRVASMRQKIREQTRHRTMEDLVPPTPDGIDPHTEPRRFVH